MKYGDLKDISDIKSMFDEFVFKKKKSEGTDYIVSNMIREDCYDELKYEVCSEIVRHLRDKEITHISCIEVQFRSSYYTDKNKISHPVFFYTIAVCAYNKQC